MTSCSLILSPLMMILLFTDDNTSQKIVLDEEDMEKEDTTGTLEEPLTTSTTGMLTNDIYRLTLFITKPHHLHNININIKKIVPLT